MPNNIDDPILSALEEYERDPNKNDKKAILLTRQGGYFLYGNRFCSIEEYELELLDAHCQVQGKEVQDPIFLKMRGSSLCVTGQRHYDPTMVSLIFHIGLEKDEPLRGILLAYGQEARLSLFCDVAIEELYRLSHKLEAQSQPQITPDEDLRQYAENLRRRDLHGLTGLYLMSKPLKLLMEEKSGPDY